MPNQIYDLLVIGAGRPAVARRPPPPSEATASRWSSAIRLAEHASTMGATQPKRCCTPRICSIGRAMRIAMA